MKHERIAIILVVIILAALVIMLCATKSQATDLDIKIDTIGVDTVGLSIDSSWYHKAVDYSSGGMITIADTPLTVHWRYFITPTLHYITDTTYRLTPEQAKMLKHIIKYNCYFYNSGSPYYHCLMCDDNCGDIILDMGGSQK